MTPTAVDVCRSQVLDDVVPRQIELDQTCGTGADAKKPTGCLPFEAVACLGVGLSRHVLGCRRTLIPPLRYCPLSCLGSVLLDDVPMDHYARSTRQIVNFVGVQCEVQEEAQEAFRERLRKIPLPDELMRDDNDDAGDEM